MIGEYFPSCLNEIESHGGSETGSALIGVQRQTFTKIKIKSVTYLRPSCSKETLTNLSLEIVHENEAGIS